MSIIESRSDGVGTVSNDGGGASGTGAGAAKQSVRAEKLRKQTGRGGVCGILDATQ